jgi:hypothetical protein
MHAVRLRLRVGLEPGVLETNDGTATYDVPDGWVMNEEHSQAGKLFYVSEDWDGEGTPDNISVEQGTMHYGADESTEFAQAVQEQLASQIGESDTLTGEGTTTENGNVVAVFTIESDGFTDKEYYIIGDHEYVLVHVTAFSDIEGTDAAAQQIVDSFEWPSEG